MNESKRTTEELLKIMSENNKKVDIEKLETDDQGRFLLNPDNPHHVKWIEDAETTNS